MGTVHGSYPELWALLLQWPPEASVWPNTKSTKLLSWTRKFLRPLEYQILKVFSKEQQQQ